MKRLCLLTGASGVLGSAFIRRCAQKYRIVAVHHRNPINFSTQNQRFVDPLAPLRSLTTNKYAVHSAKLDIRNATAIDQFVDDLARRHGAVDLLINAACIRLPSPLLEAAAMASADSIIQTNLVAPLRLSLSVARRMWQSKLKENRQRNRNIINLSSSAGLFVYPDTGMALYGVSKAALNHLTFHMASEFWNLGIRVNALAPDTFPGRVPIERVVEHIIHLDASTETGQVIPLLAEPD